MIYIYTHTSPTHTYIYTHTCIRTQWIGECMNQSAEQKDPLAALARCLVRSIRGRVQWSGMKNTRMIFARWRTLGDAMRTDLHDFPFYLYDTPSLLFHTLQCYKDLQGLSYQYWSKNMLLPGEGTECSARLNTEYVTWFRLLFGTEFLQCFCCSLNILGLFGPWTMHSLRMYSWQSPRTPQPRNRRNRLGWILNLGTQQAQPKPHRW